MMAALPQKPARDYFATGVLILWIAFVVWTAFCAIIIPLNINAYNLEDYVANADLRALGKAVLPFTDALWITLAGVCTYFLLFQAEGLDRARRISAIVVLGVGTVAAIGALTGQPFGSYLYTANLGLKLVGLLPYTVPLLWLAIIVGARQLLLWAVPSLPWQRWSHAALIALAALLTDLNLEQVAWKVRQYWIWYPHRIEMPIPEWPPLQNFLVWYALAFLLAAALPAPPRRLPTPDRSPSPGPHPRPPQRRPSPLPRRRLAPLASLSYGHLRRFRPELLRWRDAVLGVRERRNDAVCSIAVGEDANPPADGNRELP